MSLARRGRCACARALAGARTGHAGTLDPFATGLLLVLVGRATQDRSATPDGAAQALRDGRPLRRHCRAPATPRARSSRPGGSRRTRRRCRRARCASARPRYSAVKIAGERAYERARRGEAARDARADRHTSTASSSCGASPTATPARGLRDRMRLGHVRALADRRARRRLLLALRRTAIGPFDVEADGETLSRCRRAARSCPASRSRASRRGARATARSSTRVDGTVA